MLGNKLIDGIIREPLGGAHNDPEAAFKAVKDEIKKQLKALKGLSSDELVTARVDKFGAMGVYVEG
jgi:acetyl-CoA carboxylase carboxyl transferase subunit alpha